jgi:hypothetical protein
VNVIERTLTRDPELRVRDASRLRRELRAALAPVLGDVNFDPVTPYPRPSNAASGAAGRDPVPVSITRAASAPILESVDATSRRASRPRRRHAGATITRARRPARERRLSCFSPAQGWARSRSAFFWLSPCSAAATRRGELAGAAAGGHGAEADSDAGPDPDPAPAATRIEIPPQEVELTLRSDPAGALVVDAKGARVGTTPFTARAVKGPAPVSTSSG